MSTGNIKRTPVLNPVQRVQAGHCTHNCGDFSQSRMTSSEDLPSSRIDFTLAVSFFFETDKGWRRAGYMLGSTMQIG